MVRHDPESLETEEHLQPNEPNQLNQRKKTYFKDLRNLHTDDTTEKLAIVFMSVTFALFLFGFVVGWSTKAGVESKPVFR